MHLFLSRNTEAVDLHTGGWLGVPPREHGHINPRQGIWALRKHVPTFPCQPGAPQCSTPLSQLLSSPSSGTAAGNCWLQSEWLLPRMSAVLPLCLSRTGLTVLLQPPYDRPGLTSLHLGGWYWEGCLQRGGVRLTRQWLILGSTIYAIWCCKYHLIRWDVNSCF